MESGSTTQLVQMLLGLQREKYTGALSVFAEDLHTVVYFRDGRATFAEEGNLNETLGRLLMAEGAITQPQYSHAVDLMQQYLAINHSVRMGEVLVALGYLTVQDIQNALIAQASKRIARLMQFPALRWERDDASPRLEQVPNYPMRVEPRILEGIARYYDRQAMRALLGGFLASYTMLRADAELIGRCFGLSADATRRIATLDGSLTLEGWLDLQAEHEAWCIATALAMTGVIAPSPAPPTQAVIKRTRSEKPSLAPPGSTGSFEVALVRDTAILKPPALPKIINAPNAAAQASLERLEAEAALQRGLELLTVEHYVDAAQCFAEAVRAMPQATEYQLYRAWAQARATGPLDKFNAGELESLALSTAKQDSQHAFPSYVLGHVALSRNDRDTALRWFRVAHRRNPDNKDASDHIARLSAGKK